MALAAVVLPIPISPIPSRSTPPAEQLAGEIDPDRNGPQGLGTGHRRTEGHVRGPVADPRLDQPSAAMGVGAESRDR